MRRLVLARFGWGALVAGLTLFAAFRAGGYFADSVGIVCAALLAIVALRVATVTRPFAGWGRRALFAISALALFGLWSLLSLAWSHAAGRTVIEFDRVLAYVLTLALFAAGTWSPQRLRVAALATAGAAVVVSVAALLTRLAPDAFQSSTNIQPERLSFPLTYWNALALLAAIGLVLCLHFAADRSVVPAGRALACAPLPALSATLLLTYSRGGVAIVALMVVAYLALARPAGAVAALLAGLPTAALAAVAAYRADLLASSDPTSPAAAAQGHTVAVVVGVCTLAAALVCLALARGPEQRVRLPRAARSRRVRLAALALVALVLVVPLGRAVVHQLQRFSAAPSAASVADTRNRLSDPSSNGRTQYWHAALDAFRSQPVRGSGAGTYQLDWWQHRTVPQTVTEAHSLYLQTLAETGIVGLALLVAALALLVAALVRRLAGPERALVAAVLTCVVGWLIHAAFDWDWQVPAVTFWLFALAGIAVARTAQSHGQRPPLGWLPRAAIGVVALTAAVAPALVAVSQRKLDDALNAYDRGDCATAVDDARTARAALPLRAEPRMLLGFCAVRGGHRAEAVGDLRAAVSRDSADWEAHYGLALALAATGGDPRVQVSAAQRLNPLEPELQGAFAGPPQAWGGQALGAQVFVDGLPHPPIGG